MAWQNNTSRYGIPYFGREENENWSAYNHHRRAADGHREEAERLQRANEYLIDREGRASNSNFAGNPSKWFKGGK